MTYLLLFLSVVSGFVCEVKGKIFVREHLGCFKHFKISERAS